MKTLTDFINEKKASGFEVKACQKKEKAGKYFVVLHYPDKDDEFAAIEPQTAELFFENGQPCKCKGDKSKVFVREFIPTEGDHKGEPIPYVCSVYMLTAEDW